MNGTTESKYERYYYLKSENFDKTGQYVGCVCILRNLETGTFSRGISLCRNDKDHFIKKRARGIAFSRASFAMKAERNADLFGYIKKATITNIGDSFLSKIHGIESDYGFKIAVADGSNISANLSQPGIVLSEKEMRMWDDVINPNSSYQKS